MVRIPRAEPALQTQIADQPMSVGDGYAAPGKAMQAMGHGLNQLGAGLDAWTRGADAEAEKENAALDQLDLYTRKMQADEAHHNFAQQYWSDPKNDGGDFAEKARENAAVNYSDFTPRSKAYAGPKGALALARLQDTPRFYTEQRAGRERVLVDRATDGLTAHFSMLPKEGENLDDQQFTALLKDRLDGAQKLIDAIPVGPHRKALAERAADLAVKSLASRGLKELPVADEYIKRWMEESKAAPVQSPGQTGADFGALTSGRPGRASSDGAGMRGWVTRDARWKGLNQFEKAAAMALMEADGMRTDDAKNALGAMINRAAKNGEDLGHHVSRAIYQPTFESAQQARLPQILNSPQFREMTAWAERRAAGQEPDPVNGATHFLAHERTMLALEAREPGKYRSWRGWSGFDDKTGQYRGVLARDNSHAFVSPGGAFSYSGGRAENTIPGGQAQQGQSPKGRLLTSLENAPSPNEIASSGAKFVDIDLNSRGSVAAVAAAKQAGAKVAAYHEGAGGGSSWGEGNRDMTSAKELAKLGKDAVAAQAKGADYLHVDNLDKMDAAGLAKVAKTVQDATGGKVSIIAKNNLPAWVEAIKSNPDLKPPYAVAEHAIKDAATVAAAQQLHEMGVPVHFVEFADPGKDKLTGKPRTDPTSTPEELQSFVKANPWAEVVHMKSQDAYDGRESAGAKTYRMPSPDEAPRFAQAQTGTATDAAGTSGLVPTRRFNDIDRAFLDRLLKERDGMEARHQKYLEHLQALQRFNGFLDGSVPFNKHADTDRKLVDKVFEAASTGEASAIGQKVFSGDPAAVAMAVTMSQKLDYTPKVIAEALLGLVHTKDPKKRGLGYEAAGSILQSNPYAFDETDNGKKLKTEAEDYTALVGSGRTPDEALLRIDEMRSPKWQEAKEAREKVGKKTADTFTAATVASAFDSSWGWQFNPDTAEGEIAALRYKRAYLESFIRTGDDAVAKRQAELDLKRTYGVSTLWGGGGIMGGGKAMQFPPEKSYPAILNLKTMAPDHTYIKDELLASVKKHNGGQEVPIADIELIGDDQTRQEIARRATPSYHVRYKIKDKDGYPIIVDIPDKAGRFFLSPEQISAKQAEAIKELNDQRIKRDADAKKGPSDKLKDAVKELTAPIELPGKPREPTKEQLWLQEQIKKLRGYQAPALPDMGVAP